MRFRFALLVLLLTTVLAVPAMAETDTPGWYFDADLGGVWTAGNSESSALGAAATLRRVIPRWQFIVNGSASQTQTTNKTRTATGTVDDFDVDETSVTDKTAELYKLAGYSLFDISPHFFALGGVDWMRNRPAGIDSRTLFALGAGNTWWTGDDSKFRTFYNGTWTFQDDVVENPVAASDFPGIQIGYVLRHQFTESTRLESDIVADLNLDDTEDLRADWYNALPVSISSRLELKPAVRLLWRNQPSLEQLPLLDGSGTPTGENVLTPLNELDTIFTLALVIKFQPDPEG
ncbi:hypothetical protein DRQ53_12860 [bacterium]|nr:MAG: hypothetical protein DRQ53_12860 [bacterium]